MALDGVVGQNRDVSASGVYVTFVDGAVHHLQAGMSTQLEMVFEHANADGPWTITCHGEVIRVDRDARHVGVGVRITSYRFGSAGVIGGEAVSARESQ
jgi:hypothetical protein